MKDSVKLAVGLAISAFSLFLIRGSVGTSEAAPASAAAEEANVRAAGAASIAGGAAFQGGRGFVRSVEKTFPLIINPDGQILTLGGH